MFEKFIIYAEKNVDNPGYKYELGQYGFMDNTLDDVLTDSDVLNFYVILTEYEKRKRTNRFSTTISFEYGDDCIYLEGTHSKKIVYEVYEDEDCNKLIESRTISGEEFAELAKEIIRTKKNAYESVRRPRGRMLNEEGFAYSKIKDDINFSFDKYIIARVADGVGYSDKKMYLAIDDGSENWHWTTKYKVAHLFSYAEATKWFTLFLKDSVKGKDMSPYGIDKNDICFIRCYVEADDVYPPEEF